MKISIIIPTFNSSETIQDTINSVIFQNFKNYEIIIVDNNSKDKTIEIIKKNRLIDIKFIIEKDNGVYDAINKGIKLSTGKIISLLHSDDIYYDNKVLDNENLMEAGNCGTILISSAVNVSYPMGSPTRVLRPGGGIGRHPGLRSRCRNACEFESRLGHQLLGELAEWSKALPC